MMAASPRPLYLLAGGNWRARKTSDPMIAQVLAQANKERPSVAYIGAASDDNYIFFRWVSRFLRQSGAGEVLLVRVASRRADLAEATTILDESDMVFVSGGDVEAGMNNLAISGIIPHLEKLYHAGKPFFGMSAGSIMLAQCWVRWADPKDDRTAEVFPCLGLAPVRCDTHAESDDWEELKVLLKLSAPAIGYGIPGSGALRSVPDSAPFPAALADTSP